LASRALNGCCRDLRNALANKVENNIAVGSTQAIRYTVYYM